MVPPVGIEPTSTVLQTGAMTTFAKAAINICVKTYEHITPEGLYFHLCLYEGVCCVMVQDVYDNTYFELQYFTDVNKALRFINNL